MKSVLLDRQTFGFFFTPSEKHNKQRHTETLLLLSDPGFNSPLIETRRQLAPKCAPQLFLG